MIRFLAPERDAVGHQDELDAGQDLVEQTRPSGSLGLAVVRGPASGAVDSCHRPGERPAIGNPDTARRNLRSEVRLSIGRAL
jgi:hypothetical protein